MKQYHDMLRHILENGVDKTDRTGIGTRSVFGYQTRFDLAEGFPLLTTKKVPLRLIIHELLWFLKGDTNIRYLVENDVNIWNEWPFQGFIEANDLGKYYPMYSEAWKARLKEFIDRLKIDDDFARNWGDLGPVYGKQWVRWQAPDGSSINQIKDAQEMIRKSPDSRRIIVAAWNTADIQELVRSKTAAPPLCHTMFQFNVANGRLSCQLYQRSADSFLGVPFNIASYSLLTMMMAQATGYEPGEFIHTFGDLHIYNNHFDQVQELLAREPKPLPRLKLNPEVKDIFSFKFEDFELVNYDSHPAIRAPIAV